MSGDDLFRLISRRDIDITFRSRNLIFQTALHGPRSRSGQTILTSLGIASSIPCNYKLVHHAPTLQHPAILHKTHNMIRLTTVSPASFPLG